MSTEGTWKSSYYHIGSESEINVARDGGTLVYYAAVLEFSTEGLSFSSIKKLTLELTQTSWREKKFSADATSAILCSNGELPDGTIKPLTIHNLADKNAEQFSQLGAPFIGYADYGLDLSNWKEQWTIDLTGKENAIEPNQKYYIYLKRRISFANNGDNKSGFLPLKNPIYNTQEAINYTLKLEGYPFDNESINPDNYILQPTSRREYQLEWQEQGEERVCQFNIHHKLKSDNGADIIGEVLTQEELEQLGIEWSLQVNSDITNYPQMSVNNGLFRYLPDKNFYGEIKIIASWNKGACQLSSVITIPSKWKNLKNWLVGYACKMFGTSIPEIAPIYYNYKGHIVKTLPDYKDFEKQYKYLVINTVHQNSYSLFITSEPLLYNPNTDAFFIDPDLKKEDETPITEIVYSISDGTKQWNDFIKITDTLNNFQINPIWISKEAVMDNTTVKYYEPTPVYYYQRGELK